MTALKNDTKAALALVRGVCINLGNTYGLKTWLKTKLIAAAQAEVNRHFLLVPASEIRYCFDARVGLITKTSPNHTLKVIGDMYDDKVDDGWALQQVCDGPQRTEKLQAKMEAMVYAHVALLGGKVHEFKWMDSPGIGRHGFEFRTTVRLSWKDLGVIQINMSHLCRETNKHLIPVRIFVEKQRVFSKPE
ncbi:hypothetical protein Q8F55_006187 [Vanrija albida]|uniref:Uncharacterized protein n=1 Tax=Vanrija albida TaxID=181172 RepID=A0ABR3PWF9_9TREE